jgi:hypothetical protein
MLRIEAVAAVTDVTDVMSGGRIRAMASNVADNMEQEGCLRRAASAVHIRVLRPDLPSSVVSDSCRALEGWSLAWM